MTTNIWSAFLGRLRASWQRSLNRRNSLKGQPRRRPALELLEDRAVPATFHVSLTGNMIGDGSAATPFRTVQAAIDAAAATADGNDIIKVEAGIYNTAGVDLAVTIASSANLTNLQLLGGWDATFNAQTPNATPTVYVFQNAASLSGDLNILDSNVTISGFTWVFDGQAGAGATRTDSAGFVVQATNAVITNNWFEVSPRTAGARPSAIQTASTDLTGLRITGNTFTFDATTPNSASAAVGIFINPDVGVRSTPLVIDGNTFTGDNLGSAIVIKSTSNVDFTNNSVTRTGSSNTFLSLVDLRQTTADQTGIKIHSNDLINLSANAIGAGIFTNGDSFGSPTHTLSATFTNNNITGNRTGIAVDSLAGSNVVARYNAFTGNTTGVLKLGATEVDFTRNWWGVISGPTVGSGQTIDGAGATSVRYAPWLVYAPDSNTALAGVQLPTTVTITAGDDVSAAENDFTLLQNAVGGLVSGQTLNLSGHFDWTAPFAAAAYAASTNTSASGDFRGVELAGGVHNVTITSSAQDAHILGRGDFQDSVVDGFFFADDGVTVGNNNVVIEKLNIDDFENAVMFGWNNTGTFNGTKIRNNTITVAGDDFGLQNIAIYFARGANQQITGNTVNFQGDGTRSIGTGARSFGFQNNTTGGTLYDGLLFDNNTFKVLASSNGAEKVNGIWENGHNDDNNSHITITNNNFLGRSGDDFDRALVLSSQTSNLLIDSNTFTDVDYVFYIDDFAGPSPGDDFTFSNNVLTRVGDADGVFLRNVSTGGVHVGINWNINNTIDGFTGVRGLNELSTQATGADRHLQTAASDLNVVNAVGVVVDAFVDDNWGSAGRFTDPDGIGTGFGPIAFGFNTYNSIQAGINAASTGATVGVMAGTYLESLTINKSVTLLGAQAGLNPTARTNPALESIVSAPSGSSGISIGANNVTIRGFTVTTAGGGVYGIYEATQVSGSVIDRNIVNGFAGSGISLAAGSSGAAVTENDVSNNYAGIYLSTGASNVIVRANDVHNNTGTGLDAGSGIVFEGNNTNVLVSENFIRDNAGSGIYVWDGYGNDFSGTTFTSNSITGNGVGFNDTNTGATDFDAAGNWWGTHTAAGVAAEISGNVDFTPFLLTGEDTDLVMAGFQGNPLPAGVSISGGKLTVSGSDAADRIGISRVGTNGLRVNTMIAGQFQSKVYFGVTSIHINVHGGDDRVFIAPPLALPVHVVGGAGNDTITTGGGNDTVYGDAIDGSGDGHDTIVTGAGNDTVHAGNGVNVIQAGNGANVITAGDGVNFISTGSGADVIRAGDGRNRVGSGAGNDRIELGDGGNTVRAGDGADVVVTGAGSDWILGGAGADLLLSGAGDDAVWGGLGNDVLVGGLGEDYLAGEDGRDVLFAGAVGLLPAVAPDQLLNRLRLLLQAWNPAQGTLPTARPILSSFGLEQTVEPPTFDLILGGAQNDLLFPDADGLDLTIQ